MKVGQIFLKLVAMCLACFPMVLKGNPEFTSPSNPPSDPDTLLETRLTECGYALFFRAPDRHITITKLLSENDMIRNLEILVADSSASLEARFIASEILFSVDSTFFLKMNGNELSRVYLNAFLNDYSGFLSDWAFSNSWEEIGDLGFRILKLKHFASPGLRALLDDNRCPEYFQPIEKSHTQWHIPRTEFRVKDFAALFLANIYHIELNFTSETNQRDREISRLKSLMPVE